MKVFGNLFKTKRKKSELEEPKSADEITYTDSEISSNFGLSVFINVLVFCFVMPFVSDSGMSLF